MDEDCGSSDPRTKMDLVFSWILLDTRHLLSVSARSRTDTFLAILLC